MRAYLSVLALLCLCPAGLHAQGPAAAGLAGGATASLLGSGLNSGAGQTSPAGAGASAPVEINIMVYEGLSEIAKKIAIDAQQHACGGICAAGTSILVEDPTSANQVALYQALMAYSAQLNKAYTNLQNIFNAPAAAAAPPAPGAAAAPAAPAGGGASTTPQWITNFGAIGSAIEGLKSNMSYSSSAVQPTQQSFETLVENELRLVKLIPYTSSSALNVSTAVPDLTNKLGTMLTQSNEVNAWITHCKNPTGPDVARCGNAAADLTSAQQLVTGYTTLLQSSNDGSGNAVLLDVLRGAVLAKLGDLPSVQVSIAAAGGSTRVNAFFFVNLFYLPKPSYNAGVVAIYEIRDSTNILQYAGSKTVFYDYNNNWKGAKFSPDAIKESDCSVGDTFCIIRRK
jgi:hypothetical protein